MNIDIKEANLTKIEKIEIERLLARKNKNISNDLEQMWFLMDIVWDDYGCDNKKLNWDSIGRFYSHPVWLLNGLYAEQDETSMGHRHAISDWVVKHGFTKVVDYGGGFGTLARLVAEKSQKSIVDIYEPHPSEFGLKRAAQYQNINIVGKLGVEYECLLSTDVLEHVPDPLADFYKMIGSVKVGGYLVVANCFSPVIKCHLPRSFHFRYTFNIFARMMGLEVQGLLEGSHATIFQKKKNSQPNWKFVRFVEWLSRVSFVLIAPLKGVLRPIKRLLS